MILEPRIITRPVYNRVQSRQEVREVAVFLMRLGRRGVCLRCLCILALKRNSLALVLVFIRVLNPIERSVVRQGTQILGN